MRVLQIAITGLLLVGLIPLASAQREREYERGRRIIDQTVTDIRAIHREAINGKERERYDNALRHLSEFDRDLERGHFDKDKLDEAIEDVNNVAKNNTLDPRERDLILEDLRRLRDFREDRH
jgi:hypothetical protein